MVLNELRLSQSQAWKQTELPEDQTRKPFSMGVLVRMRGSVYLTLKGLWVPNRAAGGILALYRTDLIRSLSQTRTNTLLLLPDLEADQCRHTEHPARRRGGGEREEEKDELWRLQVVNLSFERKNSRGTPASRQTGRLLVAGNIQQRVKRWIFFFF